MNMPAVNSLAPDFSLIDHQQKQVTLSDYRNSHHVLVYFYPKAMTPGCTVQACGLRDSDVALREQQTVALGISPDSPAKLAKFVERDNLNFTLLSDPEHEVAELYGVWGLKKFMGREYMGVKRISFIIDKQGKVRHIMDKVKTKTHHQDALEWIQSHLA